VELEKIDPPNAHEYGDDDDNFSESFSFVTSSTLTFMPGQFEKTTTVSVSQNAGNNYKIEAAAQNGNPSQGIPNQVVKSETLTVWRRLWVELDQMAAPTEGTDPNQFNPATKYTPGASGDRGDITKNQWMDGDENSTPSNEPTDFDVKFQPPKPDITLLQEAMLAACIEVKEVDQLGDTSWITGDSASQNSGAWDLTTPFVKNLADLTLAAGYDISTPSRDVDYNNSSFWCIHGIGAYEANTGDTWDGNSVAGEDNYICGVTFTGSGVFLIFNETIRDIVSTKATTKDGKTIQRTVSEIQQLVVLHEVLHMFGLIDKMKLNGTVNPLYAPLGDGPIMRSDWFFSPTCCTNTFFK